MTRVERPDPWMLPEPRSDNEVARMRASALKNQEMPTDTVFTCDDCNLRFKCKLAFDWWNQDGDCLYDK
jgi:hypothetical protein